MDSTQSEPLSADEAFDILSNSRRRYALHYLAEHPEGITLQELAREVAAWENEIPAESLSKKQQKRVYVSLYQTHIPKLESIGVIEYDDDSGMITLTDRAAEVTTYLDSDESGSDAWYRYYIGLVVASLAAFTATVLDIWPFDSVSMTVVGLGIILSFAVLTVIYFYTQYRNARPPSDETRLFL